ncbi:MAG: hypothetical protein R2874_02130 [Desulfobacterales bacterium]
MTILTEASKDIAERDIAQGQSEQWVCLKTNLKQKQGFKIKDICFSKRRGLEKTDMLPQ